MIVLAGADLVLPDRVLTRGTIAIDGERIASISDAGHTTANGTALDCEGQTIVPGFIDAHVHGVNGVDTLDAGDAVARIARVMPRYGVTAFCPTTVACAPGDLRRVLEQVRAARQSPVQGSARVLGAHLESNFISPAFCGAQPASCIRTWTPIPRGDAGGRVSPESDFTADDLREVIEAFAAEIATVTLAPEIEGGLALIEWLVQRGIRVSLGHSAADEAVTLDAVAKGACQVTHLFNAMQPMHHRRPGLAGMALHCPELAVEVICDGVHVHPAMVRLAVAAKGVSRVLTVSDATAATGLATGASARLGGREIRPADDCARLADGTMAGSTTTLDRAFARLRRDMQLSVVDAAHLCATTPARELGLRDHGILAEGAVADLAVLGPDGAVVRTYIGGHLVYSREETVGNSPRTASV